jgi:hypothetical protein
VCYVDILLGLHHKCVTYVLVQYMLLYLLKIVKIFCVSITACQISSPLEVIVSSFIISGVQGSVYVNIASHIA